MLIEDDAMLANSLAYSLRQNGYTVDVCAEGDDGLRWLEKGIYDVVLLDRMLPRLDGLTLLKIARSQGIVTPVLMMTALGSLSQVVEGLDSGADDYIVKPFATEELLARVRAMERRPRVWEISKQLSLGPLTLDLLESTLTHGKEHTTLSQREAHLLEIFFKHPNQTLPRSTLLSHVWGPDAGVEEGNLENYIHFVRRRLQAVDSPLEIRTVYGVGYRLEDADV